MTKREQVVKVAEKYVAKGRIDAAVKEYLKVLKENPNDVSTLNRLGDLYARIARIDDAVRLFTQIAGQYTEDGFLVKAIAIYKKIIKLDPTRLAVYESLAALYHKQGLTNEARTQYQVLGDYYLKHQDAAAAINIYQKMVELEPDNPSHHLKLAELYQQGQLWEKALRSYRTIAELMLQHGRVEEAVRVYQRAIEVYPEDLAFITDAVLGIKDAGHTGAAARLLASAVAANPQAEKVARLAGLREGAPGGDGRETLPPPPAPRAAAPPPRAAAPAPQPAPPEVLVPPAPPPPRASAPPPAAPTEASDEFFVLDIDEPSGSLVSPPADMDQPGTAFQRPQPQPPPPAQPPLVVDPWEAAPAQPAAATPPPGFSSPGSISGFSFEMPDLELPEMEVGELGGGDLLADAENLAAASGLAGADEPEAGLEEETQLPWEMAGAAPGELASDLEEPALGGDVELEVDLSQLALEPVGELEGYEATPEPAAPSDEGLAPLGEVPRFELELEPDEVEAPGWEEVGPTASRLMPTQAPEEPRLQDLLAEAEVFAKYSLEEKALERLDQVLAREPHNLDALQLLVDLNVRAGDAARVESAVRRLRRAVEERRAPEVWERVLAKLSRAGMQLSGETVAPMQPPPDDRVSQLIRALEEPEPAPAPRPVVPAADKRPSKIDDALAELTSELHRPARPPKRAPASPPVAAAPGEPAPPPVAAPLPPVAAPPADALEPPAVPPSAAAPPAGPAAVVPFPTPPPPEEPTLGEAPPVSSLLGEAFEEELPDIVLPEERHPSSVLDLDDTGMDWLREEPKAEKAASPDRLFDDEEEFFDLAAELEEELGVEEGKIPGEILAQSEEPTLEEIVEGFKKGVAENLSPEDYDTHYNLGIAYREMGLLDEAIGEFQLAAKDPTHLVDCCSMLGVSFLEKGLPELAVKWYQRGLTAPGIKEEVTLSLLYDMGEVYLTMGDETAARKTFVELYGINSNYRDVVAKLEELGGSH